MSRSAVVDARRTQLLQVGKRAFSARSYDEVSTEDLAAEAGISVGLLYHYFRNKKGYYVATIRAAAEELLAACMVPAGVTGADAIPFLLDRFLCFIEENDALYVGLMRGGVGADAEVYEILETVRSTILERLMGGSLASPVLRLKLYGWLGFVEAVSLRWLTDKTVDREELVEVLASSIPQELLLEVS